MTTALIFAAHLSERWDGDAPKQLFEINGEPILHRTIAQLHARGIRPVVIANDYKLCRGGVEYKLLPRSRWLVEELVKSATLWPPDTDMMLMLGDVCWTDDAMDALCTRALFEADGLRYVGRANYSDITGGTPEIFGATFSWNHHPEMMKALLRGYDHALMLDLQGEKYSYKCGSMWQTYRAAAGLPLDYPTTNVDSKVWLQVDDLTDDVDSVEHAERLAEVWAHVDSDYRYERP